jgi:hypothetical protein
MGMCGNQPSATNYVGVRKSAPGGSEREALASAFPQRAALAGASRSDSGRRIAHGHMANQE